MPAAFRLAQIRNLGQPLAQARTGEGVTGQNGQLVTGATNQEDCSAGTVLSESMDGWHLRCSGTVPAYQAAYTALQATAQKAQAWVRK
jgi:hypothetical protein